MGILRRYSSLGSSRLAAAGVRVNILGPHGHGANSFKPGKTFDHIAPGWAGEAVWSLVLPRPPGVFMEAFLISTGVVALGEMGDKTQLLAFLLAATFKRPVPIILGILTATIINHALAGLVGVWIAAQLGPNMLRWVVGVSFLAMAVWILIPDKVDDDAAGGNQRFGVFGTTVLAFFLAEMGDLTVLRDIPVCLKISLIDCLSRKYKRLILANVPTLITPVSCA